MVDPIFGGYTQGPHLGPSAYGSSQQDLQSLWQRIARDANQGRPGSIGPLLSVLGALGQVDTANMQRNQYETMAPYMTDQAQQGRFQFGVAAPYMADPYQQNRQQFQNQQQLFGQTFGQQEWANQQQRLLAQWQNPYAQSFYNNAMQDLNSPYRNIINGRQF